MKLEVVENEVTPVADPIGFEMAYNKFCGLKESPVQRDTISRAKKSKFKLKFGKLRPDHKTAVSCELTTNCFYDNKEYRKGDKFLIDAHTRRYFWMNGMTDIIPTKIQMTHYMVESVEEMITLYQHHDESTSVELGRDKLFGACKINDFAINDDKLLGVMPYTHAAYWFNSVKYPKDSSFSTLELTEVVLDFKEPILVLDKFVATPTGGLKKKVRGRNSFDFHNAIIVAALLSFKAHGVTIKNANDHPLVKIFKEINVGGKNTMNGGMAKDGVSHIVNEFDGSGSILAKNSKGTVLFSYSDIKQAISYVLYWVEKAREGVEQTQVGNNWSTYVEGYYNRMCAFDNALSRALGIRESEDEVK